MPIETHIPADELNIKDLSLETPESKERDFDALKEIGSEGWDKIQRHFQDLLEREERLGERAGSDKLAFCIEVLSPGYFKQNPISEESWKILNGEIKKENWKDTFEAFNDAETLAYLKIINPEKFQSSHGSEEFELNLKQLIQDEDWMDVLQFLARMKIVFPQIQPLTYVNDEQIALMAQAITQQIERRNTPIKEATNPEKIGLMLWCYKLLFPNNQGLLNFSNEDRKYLVDDFRKENASDAALAYSVAKKAAGLKLAFADELKVTDRGLEITTLGLSKLTAQKSPLPETKKF